MYLTASTGRRVLSGGCTVKFGFKLTVKSTGMAATDGRMWVDASGEVPLAHKSMLRT